MIDAAASAVRGARELAESASQKADRRRRRVRHKLKPRAPTSTGRWTTARAALDKRAALLAETRATVEQELQTATARVQQESETRAPRSIAKRDLAGAIVARVLGRAS